MRLRRLTFFVSLLLLPVFWGWALAEVTEEEKETLYGHMENLVYEIGNRYMGTEGQKKALEYLTEQFQKLGCSFENDTLELFKVEGENFDGEPFCSYNVIGVHKAKVEEPKIVMICAHYDSQGPGARDNAAGVAAILMLLQRMAKAQPYDEVEIRFVAFTAEETGHQGSLLYAQSLSQEERRRVKAVLNLDVIVVDEWDEDAVLCCDTLGMRTKNGYEEGTSDRPANNLASRAFLEAINELEVFLPEENGESFCAPRHKGMSDHESFHLVQIDAANISFRGKPGTDGGWSGFNHSEFDLIGDFDWDRTWQLLDVVSAAMELLAGEEAK